VDGIVRWSPWSVRMDSIVEIDDMFGMDGIVRMDGIVGMNSMVVRMVLLVGWVG